jgi:ankyrin repeat protein
MRNKRLKGSEIVLSGPSLTKLISVVCLLLLLAVIDLQAGEIHDAAAAGDLNKVRTLLEADLTLLESKDNEGATPLHYACRRTPPSYIRRAEQTAVANFLIDKGANVNARDKEGAAPLRGAIGGKDRDLGLIQHLILQGADVNGQSGRGMAYLHMIAFSGDLEVARLLIDHGADLNVRDKGCYGTVLQMSINMAPNDGMAKLLVEKGAKVDQKFTCGNTELHLATLKGYSNLVRLLLEHGANPNVANDYNHTALYYATKHGYRSIAEILMAAGAKKSDIVETNYGKAPQLVKKLRNGEAYIWYLGGYYGGGYAIKTKKHLVIFDKTNMDNSKESSLANGQLNQRELAGQNVTVFITKIVGANFEPNAFELIKQMPGVGFVIDSKPTTSSNTVIPPYRLANPNETFMVGDIQVHTIPAMTRGNGGAQGLGYLLEVDGLKIFHAGFHASTNKASQMEKYRKEIDFLKPFGPIDIAFLTVSAHLTASYEPYLYLLDQLSPKAIYLMGGDQVTDEYPTCINVLKALNIPMAYPEGGRAMGERFHYLRNSIQK